MQQSRHLLERERAIRGKREVSLEAETGREGSLIKFNSREIVRELILKKLKKLNGRRNKKIMVCSVAIIPISQ